MVDTQHFCLRWNNYQSSITSAFENLRDDEDFVDVTLACDGRSLKAHRVVLSACSTYFRELLKSTPCKHPVIVLQDVAFTDLHALVEFIYHGEVNVHQRSLSSFLKTAEILRVSGLTQQQAEETHGIHTSLPSGVVHHPIYPDKMLDDSLYVSQGVSPPPHLQNSSSPHSVVGGSAGAGGGGNGGVGANGGGPMVNQLLKRAAAAAALRRERNNSTHSDELALKRHRMSVDSNGPTSNSSGGNRGDPDVICSNTPQTTATDFSSSASKQNLNLPSPQGKDLLLRQDSNLSGHANSGSNSFSINSSSNLIKSSINNNNNNNHHSLNNNMLLHSKENSGGGGGGVDGGGGHRGGSAGSGGGICGSGGGAGSMPTSLGGTSNGSNAGSLCSAEKESVASSPSERSAEDVKSEPLELLCGAGGDHENSSDSVPDDHHHHQHHHVDHLVKSGLDVVKGSLRSPNDHDLDSNMHHHSGAQFLMNASENKMFPSPASFNFSMAALADPAALAGFNTQAALQAVEMAGSPQGMSMAASMASVQRSASPSEGGVGSVGHGVNRLALPLPLAACHRCDVCGKLLSTKLTLKRHKEQQHLQPLNNAVCNLCHKVFRTLNSLNNHKSIYHRRQKILHHHHHPHHLHGAGQHHPFAAVAAAVGGGASGSPLHHSGGGGGGAGAGGPGGGGAPGGGGGHHELLNNNATASDCDIKHSVAAKLEYM
ncbi:broad-complex core protein [Anopheles aquasalis]|uniref:broad-complex core protein n=1 Tax=Anopheles aquasalis TaxID=42839 RepID=UPI00215ABE10|nr:broad-complex core protein [Anopheles aquasalis]